MKKFQNLNEAASFILAENPGNIKLAAPLGLGKANQLLNIIYDRFVLDPARRLEIYTALSLDVPQPQKTLEKKLLGPFLERHFGADYPRLNYVRDLQADRLPPNISVYEFYFLAGQYGQVPAAQQNYISLNYTHAARSIAGRGLQVVIQLISPGRDGEWSRTHSLSCNPDVTLDLHDLYRSRGEKLFLVGVVHPELPYLGGDAVVEEGFFDVIVESPEVRHRLFAVPRNRVDLTDHMIGFHASQLMPDDGTLQIGIGSLSDALVYSLIQRQGRSDEYRTLAADFWAERTRPPGVQFHESEFTAGIYGTSEMLMDGFMHLRRNGILKRLIFDHDEHKKRYMHGAFYLGTVELYRWLRELAGADYDGLAMTRVSKVNDLYDPDERALRRQRKNARFFNTAMEVNLLGGVSSDTLPEGRVISGVGGQYNFVAMAHELPDARAVLMLRSTRLHHGRRRSNITAANAQLTLPRHLRDLVVTEYGVADLRGKSDAEVIAALISVADAEFQEELAAWAKKHGKLAESYQIPPAARHNTPERLRGFLHRSLEKGLFPEYPFGSDFTPVEQRLIAALSGLKEMSPAQLAGLVWRGIFTPADPYRPELGHLGLWQPAWWNLQARFGRALVLGALAMHPLR